jgi:hypothetical protein
MVFGLRGMMPRFWTFSFLRWTRTVIGPTVIEAGSCSRRSWNGDVFSDVPNRTNTFPQNVRHEGGG